MTFQELLMRLERFWADHGCLILQPYDVEVGAGTMHPATTLRALGPEPCNVAYIQPSRRPADSRYGRNPIRGQHYYQFQVLMKPSPPDIQELYLESLEMLGIFPLEHDIKFTEDDWASPTLGASGIGWQVELDGMEITQFTYFQQVGGFECRPVSVEITYGPERLACLLQNVDSMWKLEWANGITYGEIDFQAEVENSRYNLEIADIEMLSRLFDIYEAESRRIVASQLAFPAYDYVLKCSHIFNLLDSRGAISVTERIGYINRVSVLAKTVCQLYLKQREEMGYPLLK